MSTSRAPVQTLRERRREDTRQEIIKAGIKVFGRRGFLGATVDEVARTAGISRATYYLYFTDKTELSVAIGTQGVSALEASFSDLALMIEPTLAEVRGWLDKHATSWKRHRVANVIGFRGSISSSTFAAADAAIVDSLLDKFEPLLQRRPGSERTATRARLLVLAYQLELSMFEIFERKIYHDGDALLDALAVMWHREVTAS